MYSHLSIYLLRFIKIPFLFFILVTNGYAATITVCSSGCDQTTVAAATANDTIQISDATHTVTRKTVVIPPPEKVELHVSTGGDGNGQVTVKPKPSDANTECFALDSCTYTYDANTTVTLTAAPDQHSKFQNWSETCRNGEALLYRNRTYCIAYFVLKTYQLTVNTSGSGQGTVFVNPASHSCGDNCTKHTSGTQVTLTATPSNNSTFNGWQGDCDANGQVTMIGNDKSCTAVFEILPTYQLTTTIVGNGSVTSQPAGIECGTTCTANFYTGTTVTLTPVPADGFLFQNWSDNCPNGQVILNNNQQCTATFIAVETPPPPPVVETTNTLTVIVSGNGTVSRDSQGTADCGDHCERYPTGTVVSLTPTAGDDSYFGRWIGDGCDEPIILDADKQCEAVFTKIPTFPLNFGQSGTGHGDLTFNPEGEKCGMQCLSYQIGTEVTLTASPVEGAIFTGWQGDTDCADGKVTMDSQKRCIATFGFAGSVQFSAPQYVVSEDNESMTIVVNRLGDSVGQISVDYSTLDNTAGEGDYTPTNGTLTWADGDATPKAFEIFVQIDKETEAEESVKLILANPQRGAILGALATAELLITDAPWFSSIQFAQPTHTTNEIAGFANLLVTRAGGKQGEITVDYTVIGGTALAEQDYTPISGTLVWADGDRTHRTVSLPVLTDSLVDGDKTVTLTLANLTGDAEIGTNPQATVLITDTPPPGSVQFSALEYQADESMTTVKIAVERLGGSAGEITVDYATQDGTAKAEQDYVARQGTLKWVDGDAAPKMIVIPVITDKQLESAEYLTLTLNQPTGGATLGAITTTTLHITDRPAAENSPGVISFSQTDYEVAESAGSVTLIARRENGSQGALQAVYTLQDGTAKIGQDYTSAQDVLRWADGEQGEKYFSISILDDLALEETEQFSVLLTQADTTVTAQIIVHDDDKTLVQFSQESYLVPINQNTVAVAVQRIGSSVGKVTVNYTTEDGSAQAGLDYQPTQGTLTWLNGEMVEKNIVIPLSYQATAVNKTLYLVLSNVSENAQLGELTETAITLANDDLSGCQLPLLADGSLKVDSPVIDCVLINDQTLTNARITPRGAVMGGKFAGKTQNAGLIQNVTLLEGAEITGGRLEGLIVGEIPIEAYLQADLNSEKIPQLAIVNAVTIPAHTTLDRVVIGRNSVVDIRAKLSQEVRFESNDTIPYDLDLADMLNWTHPTVLNQTAILLTDDVLLHSAEEGILTAMNGLPMLRNAHFSLEQNPNNGYIILNVDSTRYAVLPTQARHILSQQVKKQIPLGLEQLDNGQITFITHTGREIVTVPIVQSPETLRKALAELNLHEISAQTDGTLHVPAENGFYSARPDLLATIVSEPLSDGIYTQESEVFLVFTDEQGKQRQQFLYPAPADANALRALDATAVLNLDGSVFLQVGTQSYKGILDYWVSTADKPRETAQIVQITDVNGNGLLDYQIHYPNGGQQVLFRLLGH